MGPCLGLFGKLRPTPKQQDDVSLEMETPPKILPPKKTKKRKQKNLNQKAPPTAPKSKLSKGEGTDVVQKKRTLNVTDDVSESEDRALRPRKGNYFS